MYRTVILHVVYGCETWSFTLREEHRLRVFENRVLRGIFWAKRDEVMGEWRKLHNEELNDLYCSPNIFRVIKWRRMGLAGHVARIRDRIGTYRVFMGTSEGRDQLEDPDVNGSIILNRFLRKWDGAWTGLIWLGIVTGGGHL